MVLPLQANEVIVLVTIFVLLIHPSTKVEVLHDVIIVLGENIKLLCPQIHNLSCILHLLIKEVKCASYFILFYFFANS